jgi:Gas vesicle protein
VNDPARPPTASPGTSQVAPGRAEQRRIALVDLLDRVLAGGVVIAGEVTLSVADVEMVRVSLRALVCSVTALEPRLVIDEERDDD